MPDRHDLEQRLALELHRLVAASGNFAHRYAATSELNASDFAALLHLWDAGLRGHTSTASQLAARLNVTPAAVTYLVERLANRGYLERIANPDDRRQVLLQVSPDGGQLSRDFVTPHGDWFARALASHDDNALAAVTAILVDLTTALDGLTENHPNGGNSND